tara:strand:- start:505 stop:885 length:381 start_codon:yes stop_codon:yes gene_type:complete
MNMTGMNVKADSYYGYVDGHHTIQLVYSNFVGRLRIQASLSLNPAETDWFDLQETTVYGSVTDQTTGYNPAGYIQFNANDPANGSQAYSVTGNFAYIRVQMDRSHIGDGTTYDPSYGQITQAILSA